MEQIAERLQQQIAFILEIDKLKQVYRQNLLVDGSRRENGVEHSWHLAMMALVLEEYVQKPLQISRVVQMVLLHDLVEIDAGDTFCYDPQAVLDKKEREEKAAQRLFGLLPPDQKKEFETLWREFEAGQSPEAKFAACLDRLQPLLNNYHTEGGTWRQYGVSSAQVRQRIEPIGEISSVLGDYAQRLIEDAVRLGILKR